MNLAVTEKNIYRKRIRTIIKIQTTILSLWEGFLRLNEKAMYMVIIQVILQVIMICILVLKRNLVMKVVS